MTDKKEKDHKKAQVMVLDTLNTLFAECSTEAKDTPRPVSLAVAVCYADGSTTSHMAGDLNRVLLTGALQDLINQIFFECKQREITAEIEESVERLYLANQTAGGTKPN